MQPANAAAEWRAHPMLPVAAALGYATSVIHIYGVGAFQVPVAEAFPLDQAPTAYERFAEGGKVGKIVLTFD